MNLPNKLTTGRILVLPLMLLFMIPVGSGGWASFIDQWGMLIGFIIFVIASATDFLDGSIARKRGLITTFGKLLDPLADKLLVLSALIAFVQVGRLHSVIPIIIMAREFLVTGLRVLAAAEGADIAAIKSGKLKTVTQIIAIILLFIQEVISDLTNWGTVVNMVNLIANIAVVLAVVLTIYSGWEYLNRGKAWLANR